MRTHRRYVADQIEKDPTFEDEYRMARVKARFALDLASLREERGFSQQTLADRAGLMQPVIARYEKGQIPRAETLLRLARALDATISFSDEGVRIDAKRTQRSKPPATPSVKQVATEA